MVIELTLIAFRSSVLTITPPGLPDVTTLPHLPVYATTFMRGQCIHIYIYIYRETSLNEPTMGPTLNGSFRVVVGLGS